MSRTLTAIKDVRSGIVSNVTSLSINAPRRNLRGIGEDAVRTAFNLRNALSGQKEKIQNLRRQLAEEEERLRLKGKEQAGIEARLNDITRRMTANNCAM